MSEIAASVASTGSSVIRDCQLAEFQAALAEFHVVTQGPQGRNREGREADPRALAPRLMVEFADGLITVDSFITSIPATFRGILDLRTCDSVILGEEAKARRDNFLVLENEGRKFPLVQLLLYDLAIRHLAVYDCDYIAASHQARLAVLKAGR